MLKQVFPEQLLADSTWWIMKLDCSWNFTGVCVWWWGAGGVSDRGKHSSEVLKNIILWFPWISYNSLWLQSLGHMYTLQRFTITAQHLYDSLPYYFSPWHIRGNQRKQQGFGIKDQEIPALELLEVALDKFFGLASLWTLIFSDVKWR